MTSKAPVKAPAKPPVASGKRRLNTDDQRFYDRLNTRYHAAKDENIKNNLKACRDWVTEKRAPQDAEEILWALDGQAHCNSEEDFRNLWKKDLVNRKNRNEIIITAGPSEQYMAGGQDVTSGRDNNKTTGARPDGRGREGGSSTATTRGHSASHNHSLTTSRGGRHSSPSNTSRAASLAHRGPTRSGPSPSVTQGNLPSRQSTTDEQMFQVAVFSEVRKYGLGDRLSSGMHLIYAKIRADPMHGGDPDYKGFDIDICNDTGSNIQSVSTSIWDAIKDHGDYNLPLYETEIRTADKVVNRPRVYIQLRIYKDHERVNDLTGWFSEKGCLNTDPDARLLSGSEMRERLAFASVPGNMSLIVGTKMAVALKLALASVPSNTTLELRKKHEEKMRENIRKAFALVEAEDRAEAEAAGSSRGP